MQSAFDECLSYSRYHPSKGYTWEFKDKEFEDKAAKKSKKEEPSSVFQRQRVDMLLGDLSRKFPPKYAALMPPNPDNSQQHQKQNSNSSLACKNKNTCLF